MTTLHANWNYIQKSSRGGDLSEGVCWRDLLARIYGTRDAFHSSLAFDVIPALVKACFGLETAEALLLVEVVLAPLCHV